MKIPYYVVPLLLALLASPCAARSKLKKPTAPVEPARAVLIFDYTTNTVKEDFNIHKVMPIASVTKLMTVFVVLESNASLDEMITVQAQKAERSHFLKPGMRITRRELITAALVASDNLAARLLANSHPSGYATFINTMNSTAAQLGMTDTRYIDPSGLAPNTSTAWDQHTLNQAIAKYAVFSDAAMHRTAVATAQTARGVNQQYTVTNTNAFAGAHDIRIGKTGFTNPARWCINMRIRYRTQDFDIIVLGAPTKLIRNNLVAAKLKSYMGSIEAAAVIQRVEQMDPLPTESDPPEFSLPL